MCGLRSRVSVFVRVGHSACPLILFDAYSASPPVNVRSHLRGYATGPDHPTGASGMLGTLELDSVDSRSTVLSDLVFLLLLIGAEVCNQNDAG